MSKNPKKTTALVFCLNSHCERRACPGSILRNVILFYWDVIPLLAAGVFRFG